MGGGARRLGLLVVVAAGVLAPAVAFSQPASVDCSAEAIAMRAPVPREGGPEEWPDSQDAKDDLASRYANRGVEDLACGRLDSAIENFNIALHGDRDNPLTFASRAQAYLKQHKVKAALEDYQSAIDLEAHSGSEFAAYRLSFFAGRALAEQEAGLYGAAEKDLTYILDNPDKAPPVALNMRVIYEERRVQAALGAGDFQNAWEWADDLWQRFKNIPVDWRYVYLRGRALQGLGRMRDAAADYDTAASVLTAYLPQASEKLDGAFADIYAHKGQAYAAPGVAQNWLEARTAWQTALKYDAGNALARDGLAGAPQPPPKPEFDPPRYQDVETAEVLRAALPSPAFCTQEDKNAFIDRINAAINATIANVRMNDDAIAANAAERAAFEANKLLTFDDHAKYRDIVDGFRGRLDDQRRAQLDVRRDLDAFSLEVRAMKVTPGCHSPKS
ncbi:MAG TPA: hypothetical protein VG939_14015 [Caulobacteraceae bacterium]|nr:hypothetical protein [Caulobacteraceae bacterium]